nr:DNA-directed RNA polymerase II subunit rpb1-like [Lolium perenne]
MALPGEANAPAPSPSKSPADAHPSPTAPSPPSPSTLVRLSPHAPGFLSDEQRRLLRGSALISALDLDRAPTPPSTSPQRTLRRPASTSEEVPDSAPASPGHAIEGPHQQDLLPGLTGSAINPPCRPAINSVVVASPSYLQGFHGTSSPSAAPLPRDAEGWVAASPRRRTRRDGHSLPLAGKATSPPAVQRLAQAEAAALRFKKRTEGLCARCLAPAHHHLASACRDKVRCLSCNLSGHKERACPLRQAARAAKKKTPTAPPPRPQASSPAAPGALS